MTGTGCWTGIGVAIMVGGGLDGGDRLGILFSLLLPVFLGGYTVLIRSSPARDPGVPTVIGGFTVAVVAGLVSVPVVAVPTSVGYGSSFEGLAALLGMLNSCAPGVAVVNIDNGFGAGYLAAQILRNGYQAPN